MEEFHIQNFKFGLDTRRDVLTSQPGTLVTLSDASVNPGGEIEKRKAFVDDSKDLAINDSNGSQGTFGLEVTSAGLVTFGSAIVNGGSVTLSQPTLNSAMPSGVTYQQLKHPSIYNGETYSATYHRMTSVVFSENYNGKAFVAALFTDGNVYLYYDGSLIYQSANGLVLANHATSLELAQDLVAQIERISGWDANADNLTNSPGRVTIKSPIGTSFVPVPSETSTNGVIGTTFVSAASGGTAGSPGYGRFTYVRGGANQIGITAPAVAAGTGSVTLVPANTVFDTTSDNTYAADIAAKVNEYTNVHGYYATVSTNLVTIYAPIAWSVLPNPFNIVITYTGGTVTASATASPLTATVSPTTVELTVPAGSTFSTQSIVVTATGGTPAYTYLWYRYSGSSSFSALTANASSTSITGTASGVIGATRTAQFQCEVDTATDSPVQSNTVTIIVHSGHP